MIYDCFQFNNEIDLLEIRLNHHSQFVDKFIISESKYTYSGQRKKLYYDEIKNNEPFVKFKDKIIHNIIDFPPYKSINWNYEIQQRNNLLKFLHLFTDDDILLYLDCDELIKDKSVIDIAKEIDDIINLDMVLNWYYFNCVIDHKAKYQNDYSMEECFQHRWHMGKIIRKRHLIQFFTNLYAIRQFNINTPERMRTIINSGWHFSNLGSANNIFNKLMAFSHSDELNKKYQISEELIEQRKKELRDPLGRNVNFIKTKLDVPEYVINNIEKFRKYILF